MPELLSRSVPLNADTSLFDPFATARRAVGDAALLWWRDGEGMLGLGRTLTLTFTGPDRIAQARQQWRSLTGTAIIADEVSTADAQVGGTGPVAFGTFAFADDSSASSVLIVPRLLLARRNGRAWATLTQIRVDGDEPRTAPTADEVLAAVQEALGDEQRVFGDEAGSDAAGTGSDEAAGTHGGHAAHDAPTDPAATDHRILLREGAQTRSLHLQAVSHAISAIERGDYDKVVLSRDVYADVPPDYRHDDTLARLAGSYPSCWVFDVDGFFGASPETLIEVHAGVAHARVLAGTRSRLEDAAADLAARDALLSDAKELAEHAFARDSVAEDLDSYAVTLDAPQHPFALALPNVWHLATDIRAHLNTEADSLALVAALHPTAAVAGHPQDLALRAIAELEAFDRGRFAGPVGWLDASGDGEWAVGLRSAQRAGRRITAWAGGGIVAGSIPEHEFDETTLKLRPIAGALVSQAD